MKTNNKSKLLLTVCIPTYNRAQSLEKVLNQLHREKNQNFQVIVSDNNSFDDTEAIVNKIKKNMNNLKYYRNEENIGFSGNILKLYELAKTRYIWFLSDDEIVLPRAIDKILKSINKYQPVVALFNHQWVDPYGRKLIDGVSRDVIYEDIDKLIDYTPLMRAGFISIIVVEKRFPLDIVKKIDYRNNLYFQMTLCLLLLNDKFKFCEISSLIVFRDPTYNLGEFFKFTFTDNLRAIFIINHKFNNKKFIDWAKKQVFKSFQLYLSQKIGLYKFNGKPTTETIKRIVHYYRFISIFILLFPWLYFLTPSFLLRLIYKIQLIKIYGYKKGLSVYDRSLNRVYKITRSSGFTMHRLI